MSKFRPTTRSSLLPTRIEIPVHPSGPPTGDISGQAIPPDATFVGSAEVTLALSADPLSLLTVPEVVQRLRVSKRTVRRWIAAGGLPVIRLGRAVRIRPADLARVIASGLPE